MINKSDMFFFGMLVSGILILATSKVIDLVNSTMPKKPVEPVECIMVPKKMILETYFSHKNGEKILLDRSSPGRYYLSIDRYGKDMTQEQINRIYKIIMEDL